MHPDNDSLSRLATLHGVGMGPGDPELLTLKAHRLITTCPVVAYLVNAEGHSLARQIGASYLDGANTVDRIELPVPMIMSRDRQAANRAYDRAAAQMAEHLSAGCDVVFLCEGDPFLFGSFAYLHERLAPDHPVQVVPGISAMNAAAANLGIPLAMLSESIAVISGRHDDRRILNALEQFDNVVIMKPGTERPRLLRLIEQAGRTDDGRYIEYASQPAQRVVNDLRALEPGPGPYFSLLLLHRNRT